LPIKILNGQLITPLEKKNFITSIPAQWWRKVVQIRLRCQMSKRVRYGFEWWFQLARVEEKVTKPRRYRLASTENLNIMIAIKEGW